MVWYGMVWYGMVWYGMVWYGMVWHGMVWYGMVWYGMQAVPAPIRCGSSPLRLLAVAALSIQNYWAETAPRPELHIQNLQRKHITMADRA
jgi:hypothetical protein